MLCINDVEDAQSGCASPFVFVWMEDGSLNSCTYYKELNVVTFKDVYPVLQVHMCLDLQSEVGMFSTLDANSDNWPIDVADCCKYRTTLTWRYELHKYLRILCAMKDAPRTFQHAIETILSAAKWQFALVYMDDVFIFY